MSTENNGKRKTWLWVLGWIFIFPVPLTIILLKKPGISQKAKYGIIAAAWVVYVLIIVIGTISNSNKTTESNKQIVPTTTAISTTVAATTTEPTTAVPTTVAPTTVEPTTEKPTQEPTEAPTPIVFTQYTNVVEAGANAFVTIQGAPNTEYHIHVHYSSGDSTAEGLESKISDGNGNVTWEWEVGTKTTRGIHSITVEGGGARSDVEFEVR